MIAVRWIVRVALLLVALTLSALHAEAAAIKPVHRFAYSNKSPSHYALGAQPYSELLQASDGNFYGTTLNGGAGLCPNNAEGGIMGCGTIFRMTPAGKVTVLYSFPYDTTSDTAPNGAFPTAGLIQGTDGNLYGVAQDGGIGGHSCNAMGCGTAFRISTAGAFTLLHQFCGASDTGTCAGIDEGGRPPAHLVQAADGLFYGVANQGGFENEGTVFSMNAKGAVKTLHMFHYEIAADGYDPTAPLLLAPDGKTLYGTTAYGGANGGASGGGTVFRIRNGQFAIEYSFNNTGDQTPDVAYTPYAGLTFGADGKLYGVTYSGSNGGTLYSLATDGSGFAVFYVFDGNTMFGGESPIAGLVLGSDGLMYGTTLSGAVPGPDGSDGAVFSFDPAHGTLKGLASFGTDTGGQPRGALIEATNRFLYGTTSLYGDSNRDAGSVFRIVPALKP